MVPKPKNKRIVGCKWIYKVQNGCIASKSRRFKVRLVAKGYTQKEGNNFKEVLAPVIRHASIKILLSLTIVFDQELD